MALQHYLKNTENYCVTTTPAAHVFRTTATTTATAASVIQQHAYLQLQQQQQQQQQQRSTPVAATTTTATIAEAQAQHNYQQKQQQLHHLTLQHQQQQTQLFHQLQSNTCTPGTATPTTTPTTRIVATTTTTATPQQQHQLLIQSHQRLKQLQLKQPTIHQLHTTYQHHHPYYQQQVSSSDNANNNNNNSNNVNANTNNNNSTNTSTNKNNNTTVSNTLVITGAANNKFKSAQQHQNYSHNRTLPIHALNQNSNFSAVSSSTGGGTASSHAPTQQSNATNSSRSSAAIAAAANGRTNTNTNANAANIGGKQSNGQRNGTLSVGTVAAAAAAVVNSKKIRTEPLLSQFHQTERLTFANSHLVWGEEHWRRVVFQDERKFNLDGPDGFSNYFHDLRNYEQTLSQRPRGNSVYVYILLTVGGAIHMEVSTAKQRPQTYIETILRERANIISKLGGNPDFILQDHNWTANMSPTIQEMLEAEGIKMQRWPTIAHDLNIMENIWGWLVREVYDGGRKFARKDDLIFRIRAAWTRLPMDFVVNLYSTLPERIAELYYTRGIYTNC